MSSQSKIDAYIATFTNQERQEYMVAKTALTFVRMLYAISQVHELTDHETVEVTGLQFEAITHTQLGTLQPYLDALGFTIEINFIDKASGEVAGKLRFQ